MMTTVVTLVAGLLAQAAAAPRAIAPPEAQIASALLAAPEERRDAATVLGYDTAGKLTTLRSGTNDLICLADTPTDDTFSVACYHKDLEPFMARGRELVTQGVTGKEREQLRFKEIEAGTLAMSREPRTLYVLTGSAYDPATNTVANSYLRWVIYLPFATAASTGLAVKPTPGGPWLMYPGTAGAHIMISPPRETK